MSFGYKYQVDGKSASEEVESQYCIIRMVDDWNLIPNCDDVSKIDLKPRQTDDLAKDSWDDSEDSFHTKVELYDFNQSYRNAYTPTLCESTNPSDESDPDGNELANSKNITNQQHQLKLVDRLICNLEKNISLLSLYKYYLDSNATDLNTLDDFKIKIIESGQIIERIGQAVRTIKESRLKVVLPRVMVSKLKEYLSTYNDILQQYQLTITNSFTDRASSLYPGKPVEEVRILLDEVEDKDKIIETLKSKAKDIENLEESAAKLNIIYQELFDALSKRGEHLSSLEQQILISSGSIDRGKNDIQKAYRYRKTGWRRLVYFATMILITCLLMALPNIIPYFFNGSRSN